MKYFPFLVSCILVLLFACSSEQQGTVTPAFYHWQTSLQLTENERLHLDSLGVKKLYVKFFDVDWDEASGQAVPLAKVEIDTERLAGLEIVPVVFITNRTLVNLPAGEVDSLAGRIFEKILALADSPLTPKGEPNRRDSSVNWQGFRVNEVQFDCDWTEQTREKYFRLLEAFRQKTASSNSFLIPHPPSLSSTIRLHQLKFFEKTGVPPVDRGMLMFYNTGDLEDWQTENSILDLNAAINYLPKSKIAYPKPLDVALPLFRWGVIFRDGEMIKLINDLSESDLQDTTRFEKIAAHRFAVRKSTYLDGYYLYAGDLIRLESVSRERLEQAAELLANRFPKSSRFRKSSRTVAFYHLDATLMASFPAGALTKILQNWER